jgi:hypothetical protein
MREREENPQAVEFQTFLQSNSPRVLDPVTKFRRRSCHQTGGSVTFRDLLPNGLANCHIDDERTHFG